MLSSKEIYKKAQYVKQIKASDLVEATRDPVGSSVLCCLSSASNPGNAQPSEHWRQAGFPR